MSNYDLIADLMDEADRLGVNVHRRSGRIIPGRLVDVVKTRDQLLKEIAVARKAVHDRVMREVDKAIDYHAET